MFRSQKSKRDNSDPQPAAATPAGAAQAPAPAAPATSQPAAPQPAPADIEKLKAEAAQAAEWKDKCLRVAADLDNFRKRAAREKIETSKYATQQLLGRLLPTIDSFEAALQHADPAGGPAAVQSLIDGLKMTLAQLHSVLRDAGVEVVNAEGQHFDPQVHEAVQHIESESHAAGKVIQQLRKGYKLSDRLLRPATVVVSKGKTESPTPDSADKAADTGTTTQPSAN